jgi:hypothetical protein
MDITEVTEGNDIWLVARVLRPDNVILARDAIDTTGSPNPNALQVRVYDISKDSLGTGADGRQVWSEDIASDALTSNLLTATDSSALTNDGYWNGLDDEGYNFIYRAKASGTTPGTTHFAYEAGHRYQIEFAFETTSYGVIRWAQQFYVRSMLAI